MNPTISVVIPAYNGELFIEKTLRSVIGQEYPADQIIVIDDGSTDNTPRILDSFEDQIIRRRIKNQGVAVATNIGLSIATGQNIAFLDQDDLWFTNKLKVQAEAIRKYPEAGFFCCNYAWRVRDNHYRVQKHFQNLAYLRGVNFDQILKINPFELLLKGNFVGTTSAAVIRRKVIDRVGEFSKETLVEDYDYFLRCATITKFVILPQILMYKKTHANNVSNDTMLMCTHHKKALLKTIRQERAYIQANHLSNQCRLALAKINYDLGNLHYEAGNLKEAFRLYFKGLFSHKRLKNVLLFAATLIRKIIRIFTFGLFSRKNLQSYIS